MKRKFMIPEREDIRAETLMAWWLENNLVAGEKIIVKPEGSFERSYRKDIRKIEPVDPAPGETVTLTLNREGLYDMLPEGLFHETKRKARKTTEESVEESMRYRAEEKAARRFFLPLEQEFYYHKVLTEQAELCTCMSSNRSSHVNSFLGFWGIADELLTYDQKNFMLALLPQANRMAGDKNRVAMCLQILLGEDVRIREIEFCETIEGADMLGSRLGDMVLGVDSILHADVFEDDVAIEVVIGPVRLEDLHEYLGGGTKDKLLKRLYSFFFPADDKVITSIVLQKAQDTFALNEEVHTSRLGFTTVF